MIQKGRKVPSPYLMRPLRSLAEAEAQIERDKARRRIPQHIALAPALWPRRSDGPPPKPLSHPTRIRLLALALRSAAKGSALDE